MWARSAAWAARARHRILHDARRHSNGILTSEQTRVIADIARDHGRDLADVTTRQNIQFHWLTIQSLPLVVEALERVGLSPKGACGDVVRNVTGCPLAGLHKH